MLSYTTLEAVSRRAMIIEKVVRTSGTPCCVELYKVRGLCDLYTMPEMDQAT